MDFLNIWNGTRVDELALNRIFKSKVDSEPFSLEANDFTAFLIETSVWNKLILLHTITRIYDLHDSISAEDYDQFITSHKSIIDDIKDSLRKRDYRKTDKNSIILLCYAFDMTLSECNAALTSFGCDELHSRNLSEGLMIYFFNNKTQKYPIEAGMRHIKDLFYDFIAYMRILIEYKETFSKKYGLEIESSFTIEKESTENKISRYKFFRPIKARGKSLSIGEYVNLLEENIKKCDTIANDAKEISKTTVYLFGEINKQTDIDSLEQLIEKETKLWCHYRNKPLKILLEMIKKTCPSKMEFKKLTHELYDFYTYKYKNDDYIIHDESDDDKLVDYFKKNLLYDRGEFSSFKRVLKNILIGESSIDRTMYITLLIYLCYKGKYSIDIHILNKYLSDCGFAPLNDSASDIFIHEWLNNWAKIYGLKIGLGNMLLAMEDAIEKEIKTSSRNDINSPFMSFYKKGSLLNWNVKSE